MEDYFPLIWFGLVISPVAALLLHILWLRHQPLWQKRFLIGSGVVLIIVFLAIWLKISFFFDWLNLSWLIVAYAAYVLLLCHLWQLPAPAPRIILGTIATLPVIYGYILSTIGFLALMFIAGDLERPYAREEHPAPGQICITRRWSGGPSDDGYTTSLYAYPQFAPFIRHELKSLNYNETHPERGDASATCEDVVAAKG